MQMFAAPLVANPARDADVQPHCQVLAERLAFTGKAMSHCAGQVCKHRFQDFHEVIMRVTLVQKHGQARVSRNFELAAECAQLGI